ncbi:MAG: UbiD family decarboxylase [Chloroflexi bacterium]|nr:UbiD family decarboxylase [Chloroflexota bacterium]
MAYYKDLREHLRALEEKGKLIRITRRINKDTELHPLVRLQFRGLPEKERKAFLFENVVDSKGRHYDIPVAVAALAASTEVYAIGMMCRPEQITDRWVEAQTHPIQPEIVAGGPVHEEVHAGLGLLKHGGLSEFPIPISTPGFDCAPYFTSPYWVTKDPDTGIANVGTYRVQVKAPARTGIFFGRAAHLRTHWTKCRERGIPLQAAIVVGAAPNIGYVSVSNLPYEVSEYAYAGGIAGEPVQLVRCKTVDLEVPATAEIVVEGELSTGELEPEAPFGEALGLMGRRTLTPYFTITCITHRRNPIWQSFISQFPPSESSKIREIGRGNVCLKYVRDTLNIPQVMDVAVHESAGASQLSVIRLRKAAQEDVWRALEGLSTYFNTCKVFIAVDEDINPSDPGLVNWAIGTRIMPHRDIRILRNNLGSSLDHAYADPSGTVRSNTRPSDRPESSQLLINATLKWPYPPISLPKREFMEEALRIWREEDLPALELKEPWWGYSLGLWTAEEEADAALAVRGEYYKVGEALARGRQKLE